MKAAGLDVSDALNRVLDVARAAGKRILAIYGRGTVAVELKGPDDPVTVADREANDVVCRALAQAYPGMPIVAEESDPSTFAGWPSAPAVWFVDPLDGTREFIARNGEFAVMIGLAVGGRPALGVVTCPALAREFVGAPGLGAFEIVAGSRRPVRVSRVAAMTDAELVVSRSHQPIPLDELATQLRVRKLAPYGSAGVKAMRIAAGESDVYCQPGRAGKKWDACAPEAIVVAAGGSVSDVLGQPIDYTSGVLDNSQGFVATNGLLHAEVLARLAALRG